MKTLIQGGTIYDGAGGEPYRANLLLSGGRIEAIGAVLNADDAKRIDAAGCAVTPGFIDIHRHCDLATLTPGFGACELAQGITTAVGGNCGLAPLPIGGEWAQQNEAFLAPCLGRGGSFESLEGYFRALSQRRLPLSLGMLAAVGAVRRGVKGFGSGPMTEKEMDRARALLRDCMESGALGVSLGIMYPPECWMGEDEYERLLSAASPFGRPLCCHIRGEGDLLLDSVREAVALGKRADLPVHISHFKCTGVRNWRSGILRAIEWIESQRAKGMDVTVDFYPYAAGATTLISLLPPPVLEEGGDRLWQRFGTPEGVRLVRDALNRRHAGWDNMIDAIGWKRIVLAGVPGEPSLAGLDLERAAAQAGVEEVEFLCALLSRTMGGALIALNSMDWEDVKRIARLPYSFLISDALYNEGATHPRRYGAFPRFLRLFVREERLLSMGEAVRKMSRLPAERLGLLDRGLLKPGMRADINVFDLGEVTDRATHEAPDLLSEGIRHTFISGRLTGERDAGEILKAHRQMKPAPNGAGGIETS